MADPGGSRMRWLGPAIVVAALALVLVFLWWIRPSGPQPPPSLRTAEARLGVVSLEVAGTAPRANDILGSWTGRGIEGARDELFLDWFPFIPLYVVVLAGGVAVAAAAQRRHGRGRLAATGVILGWAVIAAGAFDAVENLFLLCMIDARLAGQPVAGNACPLGSAIFAWPKIAVLSLAIVYLAVAVGTWPWRGNVGRPGGSGSPD